jgi:HPr kinase/phosphorylase
LTDPSPFHATLVAFHSRTGWDGVLLRGPSGVGKSDLALRLIGRGWRLVADDRVLVWRSGERAWGRAPDVLKNLLEIRTIGVLRFAALDFSNISIVVDCTIRGADLDRIPTPTMTNLGGVPLRNLHLDPTAPSAPEKIVAYCGAERL